MTQQLARYFNTAFVEEYARPYLESINRPYLNTDLLAIAKEQILREDAAAQNPGNAVLFCDTDLQVIKVWSESKYGICDEWVLQQIAIRPYDFYILTDIDMPWSDDPLREHPEPEMRQHFFNIYKDIVSNSGIPFIIVTGHEADRLKMAAGAVNELLASTK